ncbi:multicopy suppressor of a budding defect [Cladophialophora chaetospira]|uniref:Multicopy suppressor of a budding defect n=1 Tax=Cladophialophora chaetospira TaxID=386627 RepID=A0AA38XL67_9EURO|nr:multicopy suppressor of a budding defect [Cladophialophora chaetospira]
MPFFSKVFKSKDGQSRKNTAAVANGDSHKKPQWTDAWVRTRIDPEEVVELLHICTVELKSRDSGFARDAFSTFIPIGVTSSARLQIIKDFFDLLAAVAAHGKVNGLGGHKLSRYAGWWAFEHYDAGKGFESGYQSWSTAADATAHLFFAYLRSMSPGAGKSSGILTLPRSLQQLLDSTTYPPKNSLLSNDTTKVVMIVDVVSPTPYALLRRAKNFEYRDDDQGLQQFASYEDPIQALTDECRRVLKAISSTNQSHVSNANTSTSLTDPSWSRFEDIGFSSGIDEEDDEVDGLLGRRVVSTRPLNASARRRGYQDLARPTTPSWADFLSSGFADEHGNKARVPMLLPPDKQLPPINTTAPRGQSSQSHRRNLDNQNLDPGELASITKINMDDSFWWVWISSLASEEPTSRKAVFGRCALIETRFSYDKWMVMEEQVKGAAPEPAAGAYIAEKKRTFLGFTTKRGRITRRGSGTKKSPLSPEPQFSPGNRATLAPDQQAKIQQAAAELTRKKEVEESQEKAALATRRGRTQEPISMSKTNSVFTIGPFIKDEASPALQWAHQYDKKAIRAKYLGDSLAGTGSRELLNLPNNSLGISRSTSTLSVVSKNKDLPAPPVDSASRPALMERSYSAEQPTTAPPPVVVEPAPIPVEPTLPVETQAATEAAEVPLPTEPAEVPLPTDPAEVPLPPETPDITEAARPKHQPGKLRKSFDQQPRTSPEQKKPKGKTPTGPPPVQKSSGFRRLFGPKRSRSQNRRQPEAAVSPVQSKEDPAVIAARRALEGKPAIPAEGPKSPPLSPGHFHRLATVRAHPVPEAEEGPEVNSQMAEPIHRAATPEPLMEHELSEESYAPPRTRHDEEYDQLSRVDTNEREHADREFSTFDQGPLVDQPAFVPPDTPPREEFLTPGEMPLHGPVSMHSGRSYQQTESSADEEEGPALTQQISPTDRWAQIRRNAAERAARQSEEQTSRSRTETRTDDGETSGEETIESRVARIKARVAELTGNMETTRR